MAFVETVIFGGVDPAEVSDYLRGVFPASAIASYMRGDVLHVEVTERSAEEIDAALQAFTPTTSGGDVSDPGSLTWRQLPAELRTHAPHLRQFYTATAAQRAALTQEQRDHVLEDVIRVLIVLVDRKIV
jgi:hypothetical protein